MLLVNLRRRMVAVKIAIGSGCRKHGTGTHGRGAHNEYEEHDGGIRN